jgi:Fe-S cluster biogenesis protein NfuA
MKEMKTPDLKILAEPTMDPAVCRFHVDCDLLPDRAVSCRDKELASGAPLFEAIFGVGGIREALVAGSTITVAKLSSETWQELGKRIGAAIRSVIETGGPLVPPEWQRQGPGEDYIRREIQEVLAKRINPGVSTHGGQVELVDVRGTSVYLRLKGGCQGCGAANVTLKQGIEKAIRAKVPEVTEIVDVTDHAAGRNPFYKGVRADGSPFQKSRE